MKVFKIIVFVLCLLCFSLVSFAVTEVTVDQISDKSWIRDNFPEKAKLDLSVCKKIKVCYDKWKDNEDVLWNGTGKRNAPYEDKGLYYFEDWVNKYLKLDIKIVIDNPIPVDYNVDNNNKKNNSEPEPINITISMAALNYESFEKALSNNTGDISQRWNKIRTNSDFVSLLSDIKAGYNDYVLTKSDTDFINISSDSAPKYAETEKSRLTELKNRIKNITDGLASKTEKLVAFLEKEVNIILNDTNKNRFAFAQEKEFTAFFDNFSGIAWIGEPIVPIIKDITVTLDGFDINELQTKIDSDRWVALSGNNEFTGAFEKLSKYNSLADEYKNYSAVSEEDRSKKQSEIDYARGNSETLLASVRDIASANNITLNFAVNLVEKLKIIILFDVTDLYLDGFDYDKFKLALNNAKADDSDTVDKILNDAVIVKIFDESYEQQIKNNKVLIDIRNGKEFSQKDKKTLEETLKTFKNYQKNYPERVKKDYKKLSDALNKYSVSLKMNTGNPDSQFISYAITDVENALKMPIVIKINALTETDLSYYINLSEISDTDQGLINKQLDLIKPLYKEENNRSELDKIITSKTLTQEEKDSYTVKYKDIKDNGINAIKNLTEIYRKYNYKLVYPPIETAWLDNLLKTIKDKPLPPVQKPTAKEQTVEISGYAEYDSTNSDSYNKALISAERMAMRHALYAVAGSFINYNKIVEDLDVTSRIEEKSEGFISKFVPVESDGNRKNPSYTELEGTKRLLKYDFLATVVTGKYFDKDNLLILYEQVGKPKFLVTTLKNGEEISDIKVENIVSAALKEKKFEIYPKHGKENIKELLANGDIGFSIPIQYEYSNGDKSADLYITPADPKNEWELIVVTGKGNSEKDILADATAEFKNKFFDKMLEKLVDYWIQSMKEKTLHITINGIEDENKANHLKNKIQKADPLYMYVPIKSDIYSEHTLKLDYHTNSDLDMFKKYVTSIKLDTGKLVVETLDHSNDTIVINWVK